MRPVSAKPNLQKIAKWQKWDSKIEDDLVRLLASRQIFNRYRQIVQANSEIDRQGQIFHGWIIDNYYTFVAMTIRRQSDLDCDSISLARLISDIEENPQHLSREWHATLYDSDEGIWSGIAEQTFTEHAGGGTYFDPQIATVDLGRLTQVSAKINRLATRAIAHSSTRSSGHVTYGEIDECIEAFKELAQKYKLLLTASWNVMEPITDSWEEIFESWNPSSRDQI